MALIAVGKVVRSGVPLLDSLAQQNMSNPGRLVKLTYSFAACIDQRFDLIDKLLQLYLF